MSRDWGYKTGLRVMLMALVAVILVRYAEPILDGDVFWHFAYAQQMLEHHTLVPNPTLYSWTPVNNRMIYCAWLSELALLGILKIFGLTGLFVVRYLVIAAVAGLFWSTIRRAQFSLSPAALLVILMLVVTAYSGSMQKPEMFSLLFFHSALWCYFRAKSAVRAGDDPRRWLYLFPLITLIWANSHGAHVLLAPLLVATAVGEILTWRFSPDIAFSRRQLMHLGIAWALCAVAVCLTPYGIRYPLQNLTELFAWGSDRPDGVWNISNFPIYATGAAHFLSQPQIFAILAAAVIMLFVANAKRRNHHARVDYAVALSLLTYLPVSILIGRTSYLWPAVACYSLVYLMALARGEQPSVKRPSSSWWNQRYQLLATFAFTIVSLNVVYNAYARPMTGSWLGFGINYQNPLPEAEYLAKAKLGPNFYNTFDSGGYLLWRLYPQYKVMVDPRSFPYLDWFQDQYGFAHGTNFKYFLSRYPADLAIIDLNKEGCWRNFVRAKDWHLVFYGPTAAIFVHGPALDGRHVEESMTLGHLRNADTAFTVFDFSVVIGDYETAWNILSQLETGLIWQADTNLLKRAQTYRDAHALLSQGDYEKAGVLFISALRVGIVADRDALIMTLLHSRRELLKRGDTAGAQTIDSGLAHLALPQASTRQRLE